ncbi:protein translocase subunit SecD [Pseudomonadales bacterium]|nr:protein translocase subunit SecD [Gammaproteobacteria bacterium]MDA7725837.1 protein translocase subunit SecD [Pseudomonadales bacterium]MDA8879670.1 protein translocase subunit SecD [Pseudomonadales bacterium]MDC0995950.1 protein translocase subunit SecD [Pseudomonadales bacterium]MDC1019549.1 protein translocase subunit SecD [Pseudomonadales bacterium]
MINKYPIWKNLIVVGALALGLIYAMPNIYPPDYALQVSGESGGVEVTERTLRTVKNSLDDAGLSHFNPEIIDGKAQIRLPDDDTQIKALAVVERAVHDLPGDYVVAMNTAPTTPDWLANLSAEPMKYGLDLRGGVHFLLEVNTAKVISDRIDTLETDVKRKLREGKLRYKTVSSPAPRVLKAEFTSEDVRDEARTLLASQYREFEMLSVDDGLPAITMTLTSAMVDEIEDFAISQNIQTTRNRVNELGVSEPLVQRLGRNRIVVDLPGVQDPAIAKNILGKVATLEFRMEAQPNAPRSTTLGFDYEGRTANLERKIVVRGDRVIDAKVGFDPETSLPQVNITLDSEGGELMHRATRNNIGRRLGVVFIETKTRDSYQMIDGVEVKIQKPYVEKRVISLATVQAALGVQFRITGLQAGEARDLALLLRAGALAAEMFIAEERTVGASLGQENIELGAISVTVGLGLVLLFMLVYFKVFGIAANIALVANLVLLIAVMSSIGATLTLPGIAGIVLTVGMAVDANVLIFSRIREEIANGMSPQGAINAGFERAFVTIFDANLTTLIVAVILYSIGTGPVKGFAITLSIGILTSMFTAIMGTRAIINLIYGGRNVKKLAI